MASISFNQKPEVALKYLRKKHPELHFDYDELMHEAHHKAFTVAKVTKLDLLTDIQDSLIKARDQGQTFATWEKELIPTLKKKGWYGKTEVTNPKTGEVKEIYVGSRRLRNIFYTNTRVAYNVGRWEHQAQLDDAPYLRYVSILDNRTRPTHSKVHGIVRHRDDPFWATHYPPNGWNCRCRVQAYSMDSLKRRGWEKGLKAPLQNIAHKDWAYDVRKGSRDRLEAYRGKRVLDAPDTLKGAAKEALKLDNLYMEAIKSSTVTLSTYLIANRPKMRFKKAIKADVADAQYNPNTKEMTFWTDKPQKWQVQHELGHHVDKINDWYSIKKLRGTLIIESKNLLKAPEKELVKLLKETDDPAIHDMFRLHYPKVIGIDTRKGKILKETTIRQETFANIFEIIMSGDERVAIIKKYFPLSYEKVKRFMEGLR